MEKLDFQDMQDVLMDKAGIQETVASYPGCKRAFQPLTWSRSRSSCRGLFLAPPNQLKPRTLFSNAEEHKEKERSLLALDKVWFGRTPGTYLTPLSVTQFSSGVFFSPWGFGR